MNKRKIKICETIRQGKIGGGESHVYQLVKALNKDEFEPVVLSFTDGPLINNLKEIGVKTYVVKTEIPFDPRVKKEVKNIFEKEKFDILHAHGTRSLSNTLSSARSNRIPVLYTVHGWSFHQDQSLPVKKARIISEKYLTGKTDVTICVSDANRDEGISRLGLKKHTRVNYAIDTKKFNPDAVYPDLKEELGISDFSVSVGFIVRMTKQKDPLTLIRAAAITARKTKDIVFTVIGDGELKQQAVELAAKLGLNETIRFHSFREDIPAVLANIDIYALPSLWEGLPIGMLEAMAMKKAVVATPADGSKEAIKHGINGLLVPFEDPAALSEAILRLYEDKDLRVKMGENAHQKVLNEFSLGKMMHTIEEMYRSYRLN